jgi:hypothetical protein
MLLLRHVYTLGICFVPLLMWDSPHKVIGPQGLIMGMLEESTLKKGARFIWPFRIISRRRAGPHAMPTTVQMAGSYTKQLHIFSRPYARWPAVDWPYVEGSHRARGGRWFIGSRCVADCGWETKYRKFVCRVRNNHNIKVKTPPKNRSTYISALFL